MTRSSLSPHFHMIIGVPFIKNFNLLIDLNNNILFYENRGFSLLSGPSDNVYSIMLEPKELPGFFLNIKNAFRLIPRKLLK